MFGFILKVISYFLFFPLYWDKEPEEIFPVTEEPPKKKRGCWEAILGGFILLFLLAICSMQSRKTSQTKPLFPEQGFVTFILSDSLQSCKWFPYEIMSNKRLIQTTGKSMNHEDKEERENKKKVAAGLMLFCPFLAPVLLPVLLQSDKPKKKRNRGELIGEFIGEFIGGTVILALILFLLALCSMQENIPEEVSPSRFFLLVSGR